MSHRSCHGYAQWDCWPVTLPTCVFYYDSFRFLFKRIGISKSMVDKIKIMVNHLDLPQDVIDIIHSHLEGYYQGRKCASELLMPHFQRTLTSIGKKRWGVRRREEVHEGETW